MSQLPDSSPVSRQPADQSWLVSAAPVVWAAIIFAGSAMPGSNVPGRFGYLAHFVEYGVFGALLLLGLGRRNDPLGRAILAIALASAYAVTDEVHQAFVPGRATDPLDWLADTMGALVAVALLSALVAARRERATAQ